MKTFTISKKVALFVICALFQVSVFADNSVIFSCDFEGVNDASRWSADAGNLGEIIDDGTGNKVYQVSSGAATSLVLANEASAVMSDGIFSADIVILGAGSDSNRSIGLLFRYTDDTHTYMLRLNHGKQNLQFMKINGGSWSVIQAADVTVNTNTKYNVKVRAEGNTFKCYFDDEEKLEVTDSEISGSGKIGFRVYMQRPSVDNVLVTALSSGTTLLDQFTNDSFNVNYCTSAQELSFVSEADILNIAVYDISGGIIHKTGSASSISTTGWAKGIYIVNAATSNGNFIKKVMIK